MNHEEHEGQPSPQRKTALNKMARISLLVAFVFFVVYFLFFHRLADRDLWSSHEARAAQDAQTILDDGEWGLPQLYGGRPELQKPPLYYWMVAVIGWMRGGTIDVWAVRLPAAVSGLCCVLALYLLAWRLGRPLAGLIAAAVLATMVHFTWLARVGRIDMPLTLAVGVALGGFYKTFSGRPGAAATLTPARGRRLNGGNRWLPVAYLALAVGLMLKGPIAIVLAAAVIGLFLLIEGELPAPWQCRRWWGLLHCLGLWWGLPLALGLASVWFLWADARTHSQLFKVFFWHHNVERAFGDSMLTRRDHPWWLYGPLAFWDLLPWSVALPAAAWYVWRSGGWQADPDARFGLAWFAAMALVLSFASYKRSDYLLPAYPGLALFLGCVGERWYCAAMHRRRLVAGFAVAVLGCVAGWWIYLDYYLPRLDGMWESRRFAAEVRQRAPTPARVLFFRTESHALVFHVGRPLEVFVEWDKLDAWAGLPGSHYVVMPLAVFQKAPQHIRSGWLEKVLTSTDMPGCKYHHTLVLARTSPRSPHLRPEESVDARAAATTTDGLAAAQRRAAGRP
jgi:4-amino-4-deoxy-L-arabinose transferase-like glycosyltransferase